MQDKKTFMVLGLTLLVSIGFLVIFIYITKNQTYSIQAQPVVKKNLLIKSSPKTTASSNNEVNKIKDAINQGESQIIANQNSSEEKIIQQVSTLKGIILEKNSTSLTIGFIQDSEHWTSKAILDANSSINVPISNNEFKTGSLADLEIKDKVLVNAMATTMNIPKFKVSSIYLMN